MASRLFQRGLRASGAATAVTACSWIGERSSAVTTSRVASTSLSHVFPKTSTAMMPTHQWKHFSTKSADAVVKNLPKKSKSFVELYEGYLESSPVKTKMVTGSILWGIGDAVAQLIPQVAFEAESDKKASNFDYDIPRTARAVIFGFALHAPASHVHFNLLEWMTVRANISGLGIPVFKAVMEQFVYWSWISNSMYHGAMGAMQGMTPSQIIDRISDVLWDTQKAQWVFWIPVQLLNFQFIPVRHQLNVVLVTSIVWTALLSMWYPPVEEKDSKENKIEKEL